MACRCQDGSRLVLQWLISEIPALGSWWQEDHKFKSLSLKNGNAAPSGFSRCGFSEEIGAECLGFTLTVHRRLFCSHSPSSPWQYFAVRKPATAPGPHQKESSLWRPQGLSPSSFPGQCLRPHCHCQQEMPGRSEVAHCPGGQELQGSC